MVVGRLREPDISEIEVTSVEIGRAVLAFLAGDSKAPDRVVVEAFFVWDCGTIEVFDAFEIESNI